MKKELCIYTKLFFNQQIVYCFTMVFPAIVTPPILASALPSKLAPVSKVIDCIARIFPLKAEVVPNVAELPTCQ